MSNIKYRTHTKDELSRLRERVVYDHLTGELFYVRRLSKGGIKVIECKSVDKDGYYQLRVFGVMYTQHRLAWALYHDEFPKQDIDHINHNRMDNRISNLRSCCRRDNNLNIKLRGNNKSGFNGVWFSSQIGKWVAEARLDNKKYHIGVYNDKSSAINAREKFNKENDYHENHGK